uniref:Ras-associating domain-containing protein n=1 Tax=Parastrongyloides trichosuri TaxID=131310 RepID=A0A0N4ZC49_PARTI
MEITILMGKEEKVVSGISSETTCADIIYALAHSSGQKGKFVLLAKFNEGEYKFLPNEKVLEIMKTNKFPNTLELRQVVSISQSPMVTNSQNNSPQKNVYCPKNGGFSDNQRNLSKPPYKMQQLYTQKSLDSNSSFENDTNVKKNIQNVDNRPPPPAYRDVINQKYRSLIGNNSNFDNKQHKQRHSHVNYDLGILDVQTNINSPITLLTNINRSCNHILKEQQTLLQSLDVQFESEEEKEIYQLLKQKSNLEMMISQVREGNYEEKLINCEKESVSLKNQIMSVEDNIKHMNNDIEHYKKLISRLENELNHFLEEEKNDFYKAVSITPINNRFGPKTSVR